MRQETRDMRQETRDMRQETRDSHFKNIFKSPNIQIFKLLLLLLPALVMSCQSLVTEVSPKNLNIPDSKLVLCCFISPQDTKIYATLTQSDPLFGEKNIVNDNFFVIDGDTTWLYNNTITGAKITLSNGSQSVTFSYDDSSKVYFFNVNKSNFKIEAGKTYNITADDGKRKVEASCTVPKNNPSISNYEIKIDTSLVAFQNGVRRRGLKSQINWQDAGNPTTYYRLIGRAYVRNTRQVGIITNNIIKDTIKTDTTHYSFGWDNRLQTNKNLEGKKFEGNGTMLIGYSNIIDKKGKKGIAIENPIIYSLEMALYEVDANYYTYHRTVRENARNDNNPFVEPTPTFTNIKNGLGCFAASNKTIIKIPKEQLPKF